MSIKVIKMEEYVNKYGDKLIAAKMTLGEYKVIVDAKDYELVPVDDAVYNDSDEGYMTLEENLEGWSPEQHFTEHWVMDQDWIEV